MPNPQAAPAPAANPFGPAAAASNPFAPQAASPNPFGTPATPAPSNPFGAAPATTPIGTPAGGTANPFAPQPAPANPFGASPSPFGNDPFMPAAPSAPASPSVGSNPFGSTDPFASRPSSSPATPQPSRPPAASPFSDPFGGGNPFAAGPGAAPAGNGFAASSGSSSPNSGTPPPWQKPSGPTAPSVRPEPPPWGADAKPENSKSVVAKSGPAPVAKPSVAPAPPRRKRVLVGALVVVLAAAGVGLAVRTNALKSVLFPKPIPTPRAPAPKAVIALEGEARTSYLTGRRYLVSDKPEAWDKAVVNFRKALAKAERNPRATAGILEALSLQRAAGGAITDAALTEAAGAVVPALKEDPNGLEVNRALGQYYLATGHPEQATNYAAGALKNHPDDAEALFLRAMLEKPNDPAKALADVTTAVAKDPGLPRAEKALYEMAPPGSEESKKAAEGLKAADLANGKVLADLDAGKYSFLESEAAKLMPEAPASPTATVAAATSAPAATAAPSATATATTTATPTAVVKATPEPKPTPEPTKARVAEKTPKPKATAKATPAVAAATAAGEAATATAAATTAAPAATPAAATPTSTAAPTATAAAATNNAVASAGAEDHYVAGQTLAGSGDWADSIGEFQEAVKASPSSSKYALALATAYYNQKQYQEAAEALNKLIERDANNGQAHRLMGMIYETTGQTAQACGEFADFLRLLPKSSQVPDIQARVQRDNCGG